MRPSRHGSGLTAGLATAFVVVGVVYPIASLAWRAFHPGGAGLSLDAWRSLLRSPFLGAAVKNTLLISSISSALSVALAAALALARTRARVPASGLIRAAALAPLLLSQSVTAVAWAILAERRGGLLNVLLRRAGAGFSVEIFSLPGLIFATTLLTLPVSYLIIEALALNLDGELEEAAFICGASRAAALRRVAAPLLWPGAAAAGLLCFMMANVMFSVQGLLGLPRNVWTLANLIYFTLGTYPSDLDSAAALSLCLLAAGLLLLWAHDRLLAASARGVVSGRRKPTPAWRHSAAAGWGILGGVGALFVLTTALPYGALLWRSLAPENVQLQAGPRAWLAGWSLDGYRAVVADPAMVRGLLHSFVLSAGAAAACLALAAVLAYEALRSRGPAARLLPLLCSAPFAFSGMVLGLGYILAFSAPPLRLYGTLSLLALAYTMRELAVGYKVLEASLAQLSPELDEAARLCGARPYYTARKIVAPLLAPSLWAGGTLVFLASFREIETSVLLAGPGREVFGYQLFNGFQDGTWRQISALALLGAGVCAVAAVSAAWAQNRRPS